MELHSANSLIQMDLQSPFGFSHPVAATQTLNIHLQGFHMCKVESFCSFHSFIHLLIYFKDFIFK